MHFLFCPDDFFKSLGRDVELAQTKNISTGRVEMFFCLKNAVF